MVCPMNRLIYVPYMMVEVVGTTHRVRGFNGFVPTLLWWGVCSWSIFCETSVSRISAACPMDPNPALLIQSKKHFWLKAPFLQPLPDFEGWEGVNVNLWHAFFHAIINSGKNPRLCLGVIRLEYTLLSAPRATLLLPLSATCSKRLNFRLCIAFFLAKLQKRDSPI